MSPMYTDDVVGALLQITRETVPAKIGIAVQMT